MEYNKVRETIDKIVKAIENGDYNVYYDEPNCFEVCTAPDGRTFYKGIDCDGPKTSSDSGTCYVDVGGYSFSCDLNSGDYESDFFDEIEDKYESEDGFCELKEDLIEEVVDAIDSREGIYFHMLDDMDEIMEVYAMINNIKDPEYYWWEDEDCPVDMDDDYIKSNIPSNLGYGIVNFGHRKFYLVEEPSHEEGEQIYAVECEKLPTDQGKYSTFLLTLSYNDKGGIIITACEESEIQYNIIEGYVE